MPSTSPKILCVDDEPNVLTLRKVLLGSAGYEVLVAEEGQSGLRVFRETNVDVVVLDYKMPGMTGDEVAREMRSVVGDGVPGAVEAAVERLVGRQRRPLSRRAREPVEEFLRQVAGFDGLGELLRNVGFSEDDFDFHSGFRTP